MENKKLNNEGFSLIELIVVIAIMAILAGVLALNLPKFSERAKTSADTQTADQIKSAIEIALVDPEINDAPTTAVTVTNVLTKGANPSANTATGAPTGNTNFWSAVAKSLGYADTAAMFGGQGITSTLKSSECNTIIITISADSAVKVEISNGTSSVITVGH